MAKKERKPSKHYRGWYRFLRTILFPVYLFLFRIKTIGKHNLPLDGKYILSGNHRSWKDVPVVAFNLSGYMRFVSKEEHLETKLLGYIITKIDALTVNRGASDMKFIRRAISSLNNNEPLLIFPEGTRNKSENDEMLALKGGTALLARRTGAQIVPVIIYTSPKFFKRNYLYIGEPISLNTDGADKNTLDDCAVIIRQSMIDAKNKLDEIVRENKVKQYIKEDKKLLKEKIKQAKRDKKNANNQG